MSSLNRTETFLTKYRSIIIITLVYYGHAITLISIPTYSVSGSRFWRDGDNSVVNECTKTLLTQNKRCRCLTIRPCRDQNKANQFIEAMEAYKGR